MNREEKARANARHAHDQHHADMAARLRKLAAEPVMKGRAAREYERRATEHDRKGGR